QARDECLFHDAQHTALERIWKPFVARRRWPCGRTLAMARRDPRPLLGTAIRRLIRDAASKLPELSHVKASRVLVVAGEARRASRATIRPLGGKIKKARGRRPRVVVHGRR